MDEARSNKMRVAAVAALLAVSVFTSSCGGGESAAYTPAINGQTSEYEPVQQNAYAGRAEIIEGPAATVTSGMVTVLDAYATTGTPGRAAGETTATTSVHLNALIKYDVDSKLIIVDLTLPYGMPVKSADSCGGIEPSDEDAAYESGEKDHIIVTIAKKDGTLFRGYAAEGPYAGGIINDTVSSAAYNPTMSRGAYSVSGNMLTLTLPDTYGVFPGGTFEDVSGMRIINRSEECIWGRYAIDIKPAVETVTTLTKPGPGASADSSYNSWYLPYKGFDGNYRAWWVGAKDVGSWNLYYSLPDVQYMEKVLVNFYSTDHVPSKIVLWSSIDGYHWTKEGVMPPGSSKPMLSLNKNVAFVWFQMTGNPVTGYPLVRDVDWMPYKTSIGAYAEPGANDDYYFPCNAYDGNPNTWWVGKTGVSSWDFYYGYETPSTLNTISIKYYSARHAPISTTLFTSNDGEHWTQAGAPQPAAMSITFPVNATVRYYRINMAGAPATLSPLIQDIVVR